MNFALGGTDHRGDDTTWIQASGPIDENTLADFLNFLEEGPDWLPKRIRFNSPGGNLSEGVALGEELRRRGFATEVGDHEPHPDYLDAPYWDFSRRTPGICASACAFAFMGGVERRIYPGSRIGVHQFYSAGEDESSSSVLPSLVPEGTEQEIVSLLLGYTLKMGIDARVLVNAGLHRPDEMYWIEANEEAREAGLIFAPREWSEWSIKPLGKGVIAESVRVDGRHKMAALCTDRGGAFFDLFITDDPFDGSGWTLRNWVVDQCLPAGSYSLGPGALLVLGNRVESRDVRVIERLGGFGLRFPLGRNPVVVGDASFLYDDAPAGACITSRFLGSDLNMLPSIKIAFRNCIQ